MAIDLSSLVSQLATQKTQDDQAKQRAAAAATPITTSVGNTLGGLGAGLAKILMPDQPLVQPLAKLIGTVAGGGIQGVGGKQGLTGGLESALYSALPGFGGALGAYGANQLLGKDYARLGGAIGGFGGGLLSQAISPQGDVGNWIGKGGMSILGAGLGGTAGQLLGGEKYGKYAAPIGSYLGQAALPAAYQSLTGGTNFISNLGTGLAQGLKPSLIGLAGGLVGQALGGQVGADVGQAASMASSLYSTASAIAAPAAEAGAGLVAGLSSALNYIAFPLALASIAYSIYSDNRAFEKEKKKEKNIAIEKARVVDTQAPKILPLWNALLESGQQRLTALRNQGYTDTELQQCFDMDTRTGFTGKERGYLSLDMPAGTFTGFSGGGRTATLTDNYDQRFITFLTSGKLTNANLEQFVSIFDANTTRYTNPESYYNNQEYYDELIAKGNAFLDPYLGITGYTGMPGGDTTRGTYDFTDTSKILTGADTYQPWRYFFNSGQMAMLQPMIEQQRNDSLAAMRQAEIAAEGPFSLGY